MNYIIGRVTKILSKKNGIFNGKDDQKVKLKPNE
jgi:hypothetical protein